MGHNDLAQWRGVVSENPFTIPNPQVLDWAYISGERRWVRRTSSTWAYQSPAPAAFDARYRSQHSAETAGLVTVGAFIFSNSHHAMRIIRTYSGDVPGPPIFEWRAFQAPALNLEPWAFRDDQHPRAGPQARSVRPARHRPDSRRRRADLRAPGAGPQRPPPERSRPTTSETGSWPRKAEAEAAGTGSLRRPGRSPLGTAKAVDFQSLTGTPWGGYSRHPQRLQRRSHYTDRRSGSARTTCERRGRRPWGGGHPQHHRVRQRRSLRRVPRPCARCGP